MSWILLPALVLVGASALAQGLLNPVASHLDNIRSVYEGSYDETTILAKLLGENTVSQDGLATSISRNMEGAILYFLHLYNTSDKIKINTILAASAGCVSKDYIIDNFGKEYLERPIGVLSHTFSGYKYYTKNEIMYTKRDRSLSATISGGCVTEVRVSIEAGELRQKPTK